MEPGFVWTTDEINAKAMLRFSELHSWVEHVGPSESLQLGGVAGLLEGIQRVGSSKGHLFYCLAEQRRKKKSSNMYWWVTRSDIVLIVVKHA
uniref:Uncharacterized protein n=1 Tax=Nelumbo nucifera TaxID=4432 RepID=A0A822YQ18_NELNU|nr:TPA_asm: hypothetical protein HUJ06_012291 [Nelumbo nucifera]